MPQFPESPASAHPYGTEFTLPLGHRVSNVAFFFGKDGAVLQLDARLDHLH